MLLVNKKINEMTQNYYYRIGECKYYTHIYMYMYLPTPIHKQDVTQVQSFQQNLAGLHLEFSFSKTGCHTKVKEPSLPYYLFIAERRIARCILFPSVLALCEMQTALSRI